MVVGNRDKLARIQEAMYDLGLAVDGFIAKEGEQSSNAFASLARHCSVFLRKMVIGDRDKASTRLLDEETCQNAELRFGRLRRIPQNRRTLRLVPVDIQAGLMTLTKLNEETKEPELVHNVPAGRQRLSFSVDWPLPGMATWHEQPTPDDPWVIRREELFLDDASLKLDEWLGATNRDFRR